MFRGLNCGVPSFSLTGPGAFLVPILTPLLFRLSLSGRLAALSCDHHGLRGCPDLSSSFEYLFRPSIQFLYCCRRIQRQRVEEWGGRPKAPLEILEDSIHTVRINVLDSSSKSYSKIADGFVSRLKMVCRELIFPSIELSTCTGKQMHPTAC